MFRIFIILVIRSLNSFFFARDDNYNKCISVPFYKGLIISYPDILAKCGVFILF